MGDFKDINDLIYDNLMEELADMGYENISTNANNAIVDLIDARHEDSELFQKLVDKAIEIIEADQKEEKEEKEEE